MSLTAKQLRAAARHARELAMECVNGTAPEFGVGHYWLDEECGHGNPCCALGHLQYRSGIGRPNDIDSPVFHLPEPATEAWQFVGRENDSSRGADRRAVLQWAFLYLADELENAARKSRPQKELHP